MPDFLIAYSNVTLKRRHASASPCRTPSCIVKGAKSFDQISIWICMPDIIILTNLINFFGIFRSFMATYICYVHNQNTRITHLSNALYSEFPCLLCTTEHHLKDLEIDMMPIEYYKLGAKFCRHQYKKTEVCIYLYMNP